MLLSMTLRNSNVLRSHAALTDNQILSVAPSIFAESKHESRSVRYTYIPTIEVLNGLRREGFQPMMVCQSRTREDERRAFTKHMIRLRHTSQERRQVGDESNEIVIVNSHDGSSSYQMMMGIFRLVCSNGLVVQDDTVSDIRVPHRGEVVELVIGGAYEVLGQFERIGEHKDAMKSLAVTEAEQQAFGQAALTAKYEDETQAPITVDQALRPRRGADVGADLWKNFTSRTGKFDPGRLTWPEPYG